MTNRRDTVDERLKAIENNICFMDERLKRIENNVRGIVFLQILILGIITTSAILFAFQC
ncbi:hypothetical protein LCGC14_2685000 [marine sediment metagenome]|uniref:Uncharacterized protein n=1 Tax=marine sediment metagenome TaxID=412755 RepID=A0A0F9BUX1_9ZZZZ